MERRNNYAAAAAQARRLFAGYEHEALAKKLGTKLDAEFLYCWMLSRDYRISRSGGDISALVDGAWRAVTGFDETLTLLDLVCDSSGERHIAGRWKSMSAFGQQFHQTLLEQEDPWAQELQNDPEGLDAACRRLGACPGSGGDRAYVFPLFEELRVMLRLWYSDEEFPAAVRWFWDENAGMYLKYETMFYAVSLIRDRLGERLHPPGSK